MTLDVTVSALRRISERLAGLSDDRFILVADCLADLGLLVTPCPEGGFDFETLVDRAKRMVIDELMKISALRSNDEKKSKNRQASKQATLSQRNEDGR